MVDQSYRDQVYGALLGYFVVTEGRRLDAELEALVRAMTEEAVRRAYPEDC